MENIVMIMVHESTNIGKKWSERFWMLHIIDVTAAWPRVLDLLCNY